MKLGKTKRNTEKNNALCSMHSHKNREWFQVLRKGKYVRLTAVAPVILEVNIIRENSLAQMCSSPTRIPWAISFD